MLTMLVLGFSLAHPPFAAAQKHTVLAVFAHPDDETIVGPLLAKLASEGHGVYLATITSGQKGVTKHGGIPAGDELGARREEELKCSAKALGIHEPFALGFQDQGISTPAEMDKVAARLREIIEQVKPAVVITWGPDGVTGHPDHRAAGNITTAVFQQRGKLKHAPRKLYYAAIPESRIQPVPPFDQRPPLSVADVFITTEIDCRRFLKPLDASMRCHKTQWTEEQVNQMYGLFEKLLDGRIFLRLALSDVGQPAERETGIFAGIP